MVGDFAGRPAQNDSKGKGQNEEDSRRKRAGVCGAWVAISTRQEEDPGQDTQSWKIHISAPHQVGTRNPEHLWHVGELEAEDC